jgi:hypothetical protein
MLREMILVGLEQKYRVVGWGWGWVERLGGVWGGESAELNFRCANLFAATVGGGLGVGREILFWVLGGDWCLGFWRLWLLLFRRVGNFLRSSARVML